MKRWILLAFLAISGCAGNTDNLSYINSRLQAIEGRLAIVEERLAKVEKGYGNGTISMEDLANRLRDVEGRLSVLEERSIYNGELLDELNARFSVIENLVYKSLPKYRSDKTPGVGWESPVLSSYARAYGYWYRGDYSKAISSFQEFLSISKDKFLNLEAYFLLADSYYRIGDKNKACEYIDKLKNSEYNLFREAIKDLEERLKCER